MQPMGLMTLNANPVNYFAETEQVAFHLGHLVPGIDVTNDPLLQGRLFSYLDTQITRLGGPELRASCRSTGRTRRSTTCCATACTRRAVHAGVAPYRPNSLDGGCRSRRGTTSVPTSRCPQTGRSGVKARTAPASFDDHFSQARLFYLSLSAVEQDHIIRRLHLRAGQVLRAGDQASGSCRCWPTSTPSCAAKVAAGLGLPAPAATVALADAEPSPALSQIGRHVAHRRPGHRDHRGRDQRPGPRCGDLRHSIVAAGMRGARHRPARGHADVGDRRPGHRPAHLADDPLDRVRRRGGRRLRRAGQGRRAGRATPRRGSPAPPLIRGWCSCSRRCSATARRLAACGDALTCLDGAGIPQDAAGIAQGRAPRMSSHN